MHMYRFITRECYLNAKYKLSVNLVRNHIVLDSN